MPSSAEKSDCCDGCDEAQQKHAPCCMKLEKLPDAQSPAPMPIVPMAPMVDLGWQGILWLPEAIQPVTLSAAAASIRGPTPRPYRRAMLAIWRL
ncbi:hypothetical protein HNR46_000196 [Haloferula luteola]|uniref:Uncharacterized protein n=1 Tax=Haloferula luteola TaxID=595692 RepID=A0A840UW70_9BACT|nr:hypothetical protein [Haloferula luteola]MBB5349975.1 hypothetical protein [Haloferula luteola]